MASNDHRVFVAEFDELDAATLTALTQAHPYGDYRRYRTMPVPGAEAYFAERLGQAAARPGTIRLLARDRSDDRPAGLMLVQSIPEDSELLGLSMAGIPALLVRADHPAPRRVLRGLLDSLPFVVQREGFDHVSVRTDSADIAAYQELTDAQFRLVETMVSMAYDTARRGAGELDPKEFGFDGTVRPVEAKDIDAIAELSAKSFTLNRYHLDEDIPAKDAGTLMARWARSYCEDALRGDEADHQVWVAEGPGGEMAGYLGHQLNRALQKHTEVLVSGRALLAVGDQRSRVGQMLSRAHTWASRGDYKEADTQLNNYGMIKVAFNLDMDMVRTKYTFHRSFLR